LGQEKINNSNLWEPFIFFLGSWSGHETGKAGIGKGSRTYQFIMDSTYIFAKNISRFEPQEKNPKGETHEDWAFISYDNNRKKFVLREFNIEGFVNHYVLDSLSDDHKTFIFVSESSENAPSGLKARLTYKIENDDAFVEIFELAFAGKDFSEWLKNFWRRE
jgi:hypothetical protein